MTGLKRKLLLGLALGLGVPVVLLLVLMLSTTGTAAFSALILFTIVSMLTGTWILWGPGRMLLHMDGAMGAANTPPRVERRPNDTSTLMTSYNRMLLTIEQQAAEIDAFATRLDSAYKEMESTNDRLKEKLFTDEVTGLSNRRFLLLRLEEEMLRRGPLALLLLELEALRVVADTAGCVAYDDALTTFAETLTACDRPAGSVMARYDGSRFAVLLIGTPRAGGVRYLESLRAAVAAGYLRPGELGLRVGIASFPEDGADAEALVSAADAALRHSVPSE